MDDPAEPSFEVALAELERIVASLERGEPELTSALAKYEKGVRLLSACHRLLEKAEVSVAILTGVDPEGNALTAPFDGTATMVSEAQATVVAVTETPPGAVEPKRKSPERPVARRGRAAPPEEATTDPDDPPF
jgi:exodeoxyribonuclease VII small subunit